MAQGISAVDKDTGRIVWQRDLDAFGTSVAVAGPRSPTVVNGAVYVGSGDGDVVAFRRR